MPRTAGVSSESTAKSSTGARNSGPTYNRTEKEALIIMFTTFSARCDHSSPKSRSSIILSDSLSWLCTMSFESRRIIRILASLMWQTCGQLTNCMCVQVYKPFGALGLGLLLCGGNFLGRELRRLGLFRLFFRWLMTIGHEWIDVYGHMVVQTCCSGVGENPYFSSSPSSAFELLRLMGAGAGGCGGGSSAQLGLRGF